MARLIDGDRLLIQVGSGSHREGFFERSLRSGADRSIDCAAIPPFCIGMGRCALRLISQRPAHPTEKGKLFITD
jgi:hypothetical protein